MHTNKNIRWLALFMSLLLLHVPKLHSQLVTPHKITAGNTEVKYDFITNFDLENIFSATRNLTYINIDPKTLNNQVYKDGVIGNIRANGYIKVEVSLADVIDWRNTVGVNRVKKDQLIYSIELNTVGSHTDYTYNVAQDITYDKPSKIRGPLDIKSGNAAGDNLRKMMLKLRSTYNGFCNSLADQPFFKTYITSNPKYHLKDNLNSTSDLNALPASKFLDNITSVLTKRCNFRAGEGVYSWPIKITIKIKNADFIEFNHHLLNDGVSAYALEFQNNTNPLTSNYLTGLEPSSLTEDFLSDMNVLQYDGKSGRLLSISRWDATNNRFNCDYKVPTINSTHAYTDKDTIAGYLGDIVLIAIKKKAGLDIDPTVGMGMPSVHITPFNSTMQFICDPDVRPNDPVAFVPWESQTHQKNLNKMPPNFVDTVPDWKLYTSLNGTQFWLWTWTLQRMQNQKNGTLNRYRASIVFPATKKYADGHYQRSEQSAGHQAEFLHYWKKGSANSTSGMTYVTSPAGTGKDVAAPKFTLTIDPDEILYSGSYKMYQKPVSTGTTLLTAPTYPQVINPTKTKQLIAWQNIWPEEKTNITYDFEGFPSGGLLYNDYMTEYFKYHQMHRQTPKIYSRYYKGYLIEDYDSYRNGSPSASAPSVNPIRNRTAPADTCGENVWFNPMLGTTNNTNGSSLSIRYGGKDYSPRFLVNNILPNTTTPGSFPTFYGVIRGTNNPLGWGADNTYQIPGLANLSLQDLSSISLAVMAYRPGGNMIDKQGGKVPVDDTPSTQGGRHRRAVVQQHLLSKEESVNNPYRVPAGTIDPYGGTPYCESEYSIPFDSLEKVKARGVWNVKVHFQSGQSALALYYTNCLGEKVFLGGRNLVVQDPTMFQFAAPGSSSYPYSETSFVAQGQIDLKEGEGEKAFEFLNDFRKEDDPRRGYLWASGDYPARKKFIKTYVLVKGQSITFTTRDIGIGKTELFMSGGVWPWSGYYDMSRFMPQDSVNKYMQYKVYPITDDYTLSLGPSIGTFNGKNLSRTWDTAGDFAIEIKFMNSPNTGYVRVIVKDYPTDALDNLSTRQDRGKIVVRKLTNQEIKWLQRFSSSTTNRIFTYNGGGIPNTTLAIASVEDVSSLYKFSKGPRATLYGDRFGEFNDYNNKYAWSAHRTDIANDPVQEFESIGFQRYVVRMTPTGTNDYLHKAIIDSIFPKNWKNIFLRHCSSNHDPEEDVNKPDVLTNVMQQNYVDTIANIYSTLSNQNELGYMRIFPWIAKTPSDGYKIFQFNKGVTNLEEFFNGYLNSGGAWSGNPYKADIPYVQNRVQMSSYPTLSDDDRDFLEFYNNLYYGRAIIYNPAYVSPDTVYNLNPRLATEDRSKPEKIYIAKSDANWLDALANDNKAGNLTELFRNSYRIFEEATGENGLYREHYNPQSSESESLTSTSPSTNGMGLIALCIAHRMGWDLESEEHAERILCRLTAHLFNTIDFKFNTNIERWGGQKIVDKIKSYNKESIFEISVSRNGYPYHYVNIVTGSNISNDYNYPSTIDAAIMCYGALFARKYFSSNKLIDACAKNLFKSINWAAAMKSASEIYHEFYGDGTPRTGSGKTSKPFNEYAIIPYLVDHSDAFGRSDFSYGIVNTIAQSYNSTLMAALALDPTTLTGAPGQTAGTTETFMRFKKFTSYYYPYDNTTQTLTSDGVRYALSDDRSDETQAINSENHTTVSSFIHQFCYYLCHPFTISPSFIDHVRTAAAADYTYWRQTLGESSYWGCGAGAGKTGTEAGVDAYSAEAPFNNPHKIASPHIVLGYLPVLENFPTTNSKFKLAKTYILSGVNNWYTEYANLNYENKGLKYTIKTQPNKPAVLWRASKEAANLTWQPYDLQLLDFSTELFGLATEYLRESTLNPTITGANFFETYNNIFSSTVIPFEDINSSGRAWYWGSSGGGKTPSSSSQGMPSGYVQAAPSTDVNGGTSAIVETTSKTGLSVYPIPNNGNFTVKMEDPSKVNPTGVYTIRVISMEGIVRYSGTTLGNSLLAGTPLYLTTTLKTGYYIVEVSGLGMRERKSFIVNN